MLPLDQEAIEIAPSPILSKEHYCLTYIPCYSPLSLCFFHCSSPSVCLYCCLQWLCYGSSHTIWWVTFSSHLDLLIFATRSCKCSLKWKINEKILLQYSLSIAVARVQIIRIFTMRTRFVENYIHLSTILQSNEKNAVHMFRIEV